MFMSLHGRGEHLRHGFTTIFIKPVKKIWFKVSTEVLGRLSYFTFVAYFPAVSTEAGFTVSMMEGFLAAIALYRT